LGPRLINGTIAAIQPLRVFDADWTMVVILNFGLKSENQS
jgi:hypothetical protein